jgi:superfamily II DNA or RNA helicase
MSMSHLATNKAVEGKSPYPYQEEAIQAIVTRLKCEDRTHIVMACGTGKTYVSLWVAESLKATRVVVFVPSLALISQLIHEWLPATIWPKVNCLAICSDESVTRGTDSIALNPDECDFPVTTDALKVHQFLKKEKAGVTLVFCTYHSAAVLAEGMKDVKPFALGVFDEAHKTAGKNGFGLALTDQNVPIQKRLFMTATPRHYDINCESKAGDARVVFSMDNETLYGKRAYTLSFRRAMELGVIVNYKVVISITESKSKLNQEPELEEKIVTLQKTIKKIPAVSKIISFHKTIEEAHHFSRHIQDNEAVSYFKSFHVSGLIPSHMRKSAMQQFESSEHAIVTNARCLTEGIDVPAVDMVAFLNKKHSKIDIIQAIGRALRKSSGKKYGYIFLPLFIKRENGESLEQAVERADYQKIWEVLQALNEYDESLEEHIKMMKQEKGKFNSTTKGLETYLEIITHDTTDIKLQKALSKKIDIIIVDKIGNNWDELYGRLMKYKQNYGHCNIPCSPSGFRQDYSLAKWVSLQRQNYKSGELSDEKIKSLEVVGFDWEPRDNYWRKMHKKLLKFKEENGHCRVPEEFSEKQLVYWVRTQRRLYREKRLSAEKIQKLDSIGFVWSIMDTDWENWYNKLLEFKEEYHHCSVSFYSKKYGDLGSWVRRQRRLYQQDKLPIEKIKLLEDIGFDWNPIDSKWQVMYDSLLKFKEKNGHGNPTTNTPLREEHLLARWLGYQRQNYKNGKLQLKQITLLESVGVSWVPLEDKWDEMYKKLINGDESQKLKSWKINQRILYKERKLPVEKIRLLETVGFDWDPTNNSWKKMYDNLVKCNNVVHQKKQSLPLKKWCDMQRRFYRENKLPAEKIQLLESVGFILNPCKKSWQEMYAELKQFKDKWNHCNIPYSRENPLSRWAETQKQSYKKEKLKAEQITLLESIGFSWGSQKNLIYPWFNGDSFMR